MNKQRTTEIVQVCGVSNRLTEVIILNEDVCLDVSRMSSASLLGRLFHQKTTKVDKRAKKKRYKKIKKPELRSFVFTTLLLAYNYRTMSRERAEQELVMRR